VYVIHDLFERSEVGEQQLRDFRSDYLPSVQLDAYLFDRARPMREQVEEAVNEAIQRRPDLVLLDVYFGPVRDAASRMGIDLALPRLVATRLPVIIVSALEDQKQVLANIHEAQRTGQVRYLASDRLELLPDYVEAMFSVLPEEHAAIDYGFRYRQQEEIDARRKVQDTFDRLARAAGSRALEIPLVAPVSNFLGKPPRPLSEKHSNKLFTTVTTDGRAMTVRYEGTVLTAKWVASQARRGGGFREAKYHYFQEMVRVETSTELDTKHFRSFYQAGIEAFASDTGTHRNNTADLIHLAIQFLEQIGLKPTIRLSHVSLLPAVLKELHLDPFATRRIIGALEKEPDANKVAETLHACGASGSGAELLRDMALRRGSSMDDAVRFLDAHRDRYAEALAQFEDLRGRLREKGVLNQTRFDPGIYRSLDFYSGITMQGDVEGMLECMGGGDFTGLVESFGVLGPVYSFGLAAGVERLLQLRELRV
jgi:histidyl-tRNA synthetase